MANKWKYSTLTSEERMNRIKNGDKDVYDSEIAKSLDVIKARQNAGLDITEQKNWIDKVSYNYNLYNADQMRVKADNVSKTGYADALLGIKPAKRKGVQTVVSRKTKPFDEAKKLYAQYSAKVKAAEGEIASVREWLLNNGIEESSSDGKLFMEAFNDELEAKKKSLLNEYSSGIRNIMNKYKNVL